MAFGYWHHRVVKHVQKNKATKKMETWYSIHEVYFKSNHQIEAMTQETDGVKLRGDTLKDLKEYHKMIEGAFNAPVLSEKDYRKAVGK